MSNYKISKEIVDYNKSIKLDLNEFDFVHHPDLYNMIRQAI